MKGKIISFAGAAIVFCVAALMALTPERAHGFALDTYAGHHYITLYGPSNTAPTLTGITLMPATNITQGLASNFVGIAVPFDGNMVIAKQFGFLEGGNATGTIFVQGGTSAAAGGTWVTLTSLTTVEAGPLSTGRTVFTTCDASIFTGGYARAMFQLDNSTGCASCVAIGDVPADNYDPQGTTNASGKFYDRSGRKGIATLLYSLDGGLMSDYVGTLSLQDSATGTNGWTNYTGFTISVTGVTAICTNKLIEVEGCKQYLRGYYSHTNGCGGASLRLVTY